MSSGCRRGRAGVEMVVLAMLVELMTEAWGGAEDGGVQGARGAGRVCVLRRGVKAWATVGRGAGRRAGFCGSVLREADDERVRPVCSCRWDRGRKRGEVWAGPRPPLLWLLRGLMMLKMSRDWGCVLRVRRRRLMRGGSQRLRERRMRGRRCGCR